MPVNLERAHPLKYVRDSYVLSPDEIRIVIAAIVFVSGFHPADNFFIFRLVVAIPFHRRIPNDVIALWRKSHPATIELVFVETIIMVMVCFCWLDFKRRSCFWVSLL